MKIRLVDCALINSGLYSKPELNGEVYYIQARDIAGNRELSNSLVPQLIADGKIDKHFLQPGDLLIAAKGKDYYAIEYRGYPSPAVASTIFIVVRIKDKGNLLPPFVRWFINLPRTQMSLAGGAQGSVVPVISKADLESLEIPLVPIEKQNFILKIDALRQREVELTNRIESLRNKQIEQELLNAISN